MSKKRKRSREPEKSKQPKKSGGDKRPKQRGQVLFALLAFASAFLVWISFPPADLGFVMWVALVPWLVMMAKARMGRAVLFSGLAAYGLFVALVHWIRFVTVAGWFALALYCALYWVAATVILRWSCGRKIPLTVTVPLVLTVLEFVRAKALTGFPLFFIGHTQYRYLPIIQIADLTGVYGITFLIALVNGCAADVILGRFRGWRRYAAAGLVAAMVFLCVVYGLVRQDAGEESKSATVCLVQGNVPLDLKHAPSLEENRDVLNRHMQLSERAVGQNVDLLIWSETMFPRPISWVYHPDVVAALAKGGKLTPEGEFYKECRDGLVAAGQKTGAHLLIGSDTSPFRGDTSQDRFNSAYFISPKGKIIDRYDKIHIVVFGEYTPLKNVFPFLQKFRPPVMGQDLTPGSECTLFTLPTRSGSVLKFGVTICYEDLVARLFRQFVRGGADFVVNITNDGWFRDSSELDQHLAVSVFRAVENRVPIARCANTGISAIIGPNGRITHEIADAEGKRREVAGTLVGRPPMSSQWSFYTHYGDAFASACVAGLISVVALPFLRGRRKSISHS